MVLWRPPRVEQNICSRRLVETEREEGGKEAGVSRVRIGCAAKGWLHLHFSRQIRKVIATGCMLATACMVEKELHGARCHGNTVYLYPIGARGLHAAVVIDVPRAVLLVSRKGRVCVMIRPRQQTAQKPMKGHNEDRRMCHGGRRAYSDHRPARRNGTIRHGGRKPADPRRCAGHSS